MLAVLFGTQMDWILEAKERLLALPPSVLFLYNNRLSRAATLAKASRRYQRAATLPPQPAAVSWGPADATAAAAATTNYCWVHANAYFWLNMYAGNQLYCPLLLYFY